MSATLARLQEISGGQLLHIDQATAATVTLSEMELNAASVAAGGLFAAVPGTRTHGAHYAPDSAAGVIVTDAAGADILAQANETRPVLVVSDVREAMGYLAAEIYDHPARSLTIIGVTGTSGKTTTTYLLEGALMAAGARTGIIGTTGTRINGRSVPSQLTTPEAPALQRLFHDMLAEGVTHVVMEVSSHALSLGRVNGVNFDVTAFLNLSQDHLDFHDTLEDYFQAKAQLFAPDSSLHATKSVVCIDDDWGVRMADIAAAGQKVAVATVRTQHTSSTAPVQRTPARAWMASSATVAANGVQSFQMRADSGDSYALQVALPGGFNIANAAVAWAVLDQLGFATGASAVGLGEVTVPGRMQRIDQGQDFLAVVDYAHKPAALAEILATLREQSSGHIIAVVGAGGDRDRAKRELMGAAAARGADVVIVTDDNPRSEDPAQIRQALLAGARAENTSARIIEQGDRAAAIAQAVALAHSGDVVVIAGKGHETGQEIAGTIHPFDDREQLRTALQSRAGT